ncbi:MAG TPA: F0F1 ATP synthase subunit alpha, partial [Candidatus Wallbacteria bacterium]|nr:F0F1 ATP synthase subunit alpha [Candidatus Wallbacteria bacterium]
GLLDDLATSDVSSFENGFIKYIDDKYPQIAVEIKKTKTLDNTTSELLKKSCGEYFAIFNKEKYNR